MFCVYLTIYRGTKLPPRYIGSSTVENVQSGYNGTVKSKAYKDIYKAEQSANKHLFKTRILKTFETKIEAQSEELRLQKRYDVVRSASYFNMALARPNGCFGRDIAGDKHPFWNKRHKPEACDKISKTLCEKYESGELISPFSYYDVKADKNPFWGKTHNDETRAKMQRPKSHVPKWLCPFCNKEFDGGNLTQHMRRKHAWADEQINNLKGIQCLTNCNKL